MTQDDNITLAQLQRRLDEAFSQIELLKFAYNQLSNQLAAVVEPPSPPPPKEDGFTTRELGELLGVPESYLSRYAKNRGPIPREVEDILNRDWVKIDKKWYRKL
jgi:hypothetical protein